MVEYMNFALNFEHILKFGFIIHKRCTCFDFAEEVKLADWIHQFLLN